MNAIKGMPKFWLIHQLWDVSKLLFSIFYSFEGGSNATAIHYLRKTSKLEEGKLVLMDAGCRFEGYCSDITRTWPLSCTILCFNFVILCIAKAI